MEQVGGRVQPDSPRACLREPRRCGDCKQVKPASAFRLGAGSIDEHRSLCRECIDKRIARHQERLASSPAGKKATLQSLNRRCAQLLLKVYRETLAGKNTDLSYEVWAHLTERQHEIRNRDDRGFGKHDIPDPDYEF